jgi:hypothetical protein
MLYSIRLFLTEFVIPYHPIIGLPIREKFIKEKEKEKRLQVHSYHSKAWVFLM